MVKTALILQFREMECLECITTFRDSKIYCPPPKLPVFQKKKQRIKAYFLGYNKITSILAYKMGKVIIV